MKPLKNNWFMNTYLGCGTYDRPRTVCQLGRRIVWRTLMWAFVAAVALLVTSPLLFTAYNLLVVLFTSGTMETVFAPKSGAQAMAGYAMIELAALALFAFGFFVIAGAAKGIEYVRDLRYELRQNRGYKRKPPSQVSQFVSDMYKRFKDKTCIMLEYQDEIDERVAHAAWLADWRANMDNKVSDKGDSV